MSILSNWLARATPSFFSSSHTSSNPTSEVKKFLHIELVEPKDWPKVTHKAKKWTWIAYQKAAKQPLKSQERAILSDCGFVCKNIASYEDIDLDHRGSSKNTVNCRVGP